MEILIGIVIAVLSSKKKHKRKRNTVKSKNNGRQLSQDEEYLITVI